MQTSSKDFRSVDTFVLVLAWQVSDCDSKKVNRWIYIAFIISSISKALRYMTSVSLSLPATHIRTIHAFTPQPRGMSPPFGWYSLRLLTKGWPGWVDLGGWSHTEINVPRRKLNRDTVTHPSTNRARRTLLMCATPLPQSQASTTVATLVPLPAASQPVRGLYRHQSCS